MEREEFASYFRALVRAGCEVLVVDGSPPAVFSENHGHWGGCCEHVPVDPQYRYLNGKVNGVHTGVALAKHDAIILADDDIPYTAESARQLVCLLETYEMVRTQNFLRPFAVVGSFGGGPHAAQPCSVTGG